MKNKTTQTMAIITPYDVASEKISDSNVPSGIKTVVFSKFPDSIVHEWRRTNGNYLVVLEKNETRLRVLIDPNGAVIETKRRIELSSIPKIAADYLAKTFSNKKPTILWKIDDSEGKVSYRVEINGAVVCFDSDGKFTKREKEEHDEREI